MTRRSLEMDARDYRRDPQPLHENGLSPMPDHRYVTRLITATESQRVASAGTEILPVP